MIQCPCYDTKLQQVCTSKSTYCRLSCEAYKQYEIDKRREYEERMRERRLTDDLLSHSRDIGKKVRRRLHLGR